MRFFIRTAIFLILLFVVLIYAGNYISKRLVSEALDKYRPELENRGIEISELNYNKIRINGIKSCEVSDVSIAFNLNKELYGKKSFHSDFRADAVIIELVNIKEPSVRFTLKNFDLFIQPIEEKENRVFGKFEQANWKGQAPLRLYDIRESGQLIIDKIRQLFEENRIEELMEFDGDVQLNMDGKMFKVRVFTERIDGMTYLRFDPEDLLDAAKTYDEDGILISELEAEIIARHPVWAPKIIKISRDAQKLSDIEKDKDPAFPNDAYKHIYLSYQLTKAFGPEFAKELTDAHETIPNNSPEERKMDFINNEIGRKYAAGDLSIKELIEKVLTDPDVIRFPSEIHN